MISMMVRLCGLLALTFCALGCLLQPKESEPAVAQVSTPVMGGEQASEQEFYSTVALLGQQGLFCSGTLIAPTVVLTAAHCIKHQDQMGAFTDDFEPSEVTVLAGELHVEDPLVAKLAHAVSKVVSHKDFDGMYKPDDGDNPEGLAQANDIALLLLEDPVDEVAVAPVLPFSQLDKTLPPKTTLLINGFGLNDNDPNESVGGTLHIARVPLNGRNDYELAAGGHGVDTCPGDSGGPAYLERGSKTYLVGVTSRGAANAVTPLCGDGTVFTLAPGYTDWITTNAAGAYPPPAPPHDEEDDACSIARVGERSAPSAGLLLLFAAVFATARTRRQRSRAIRASLSDK